jgi:hypothetical protein
MLTIWPKKVRTVATGASRPSPAANVPDCSATVESSVVRARNLNQQRVCHGPGSSELVRVYLARIMISDVAWQSDHTLPFIIGPFGQS